MPKQKNVTADEIQKTIDAMDGPIQDFADFEQRMTRGYCDELPDAFGMAKTLVAFSRTCSELALRMLSHHQLKLMQDQTRKLVEQSAKNA